MSTTTDAAPPAPRASRSPAPRRAPLGRWIGIGLTVLALLVVVLGTKVVPQGQESELAEGTAAFDKATFGAPVVEGAKVTASVVKNGKGKKVIVFKYKPKKGYRRKQGHRQPYTKVTIGKIEA